MKKSRIKLAFFKEKTRETQLIVQEEISFEMTCLCW